jgi:tRNA-2-methylthio-N6-dimethylallyladenosine synthase
MPKLFLQTFGCQMNEHDSLKLAFLMGEQGYDGTDDPHEADCIILNTCSIRAKPEHKVYSALGRLKHLKKTRPGLVIGVGGCVAQQQGPLLLERVSHLDFVFGTHQIHRVPALVSDAKEFGIRSCTVDFVDDTPSLHCSAALPDNAVKSYVTIMQGCNNFCAYCIVPYVRGKEQSRPAAAVLKEAQGLAQRGIREITLLGQNVNSYGRDREGCPTFAGLLERLHRVEGIQRIRFTTSHPKDLSSELIDTMARLPKVCEHLHLPVQSGSTRVLERMNRGYSREDYLKKVEKIKMQIPGIALTTDVIVGFPGETDQDFAETLSLLAEVSYDGIFSFRYSSRPLTRAARMSGAVPEAIKRDRLQRVQALQDGITAALLAQCVGQTVEVLVEGPAPQVQGRATGRTRTNRIVHFPGDVGALRGRLVRVYIRESLKHCLIGRLVEEGGSP